MKKQLITFGTHQAVDQRIYWFLSFYPCNASNDLSAAVNSLSYCVFGSRCLIQIKYIVVAAITGHALQWEIQTAVNQ